MATSGTYDFTVTANTIIQDAMEHIGAWDPGQTMSADDAASALRSLRFMIKAWQADQIGLWLNKEITVFLADAGQSISIGPTGGNASLSSGVVATEVKTAAASGALTIDVDSITGLATGMYIGIELDDGTMQWTTINGAPSGYTVTLTAALTDDVAVDNVVYAYTTKVQRPKSIVEFRRVDHSGNEVPLALISRDEYMALSLKSSVGAVNSVYYDPQNTNGTFYVWPTTDSVKTVLKGTVRYPVQDVTSLSHDMDFPIEWSEALSFNLAKRLASKYGCAAEALVWISSMAKETLESAEGFDVESTSTFFTCG